MLFSRGFSLIARNLRGSSNGCIWFLSSRDFHQCLLLHNYQSPRGSTDTVFRSLIFSKALPALHSTRQQVHHQSSSTIEDQLDPFSLVAEELSHIAHRLRAMVVAEVPNLSLGAEYLFKMGAEGKRFRATVASLLHDDVVDNADTRRGIGSLNSIMGDKLAVLAGGFLLSRAFVALASLKNTEVVSLLATVGEHLVTGETMQMTATFDQRCSMEYYMEKTYYKTASLLSSSCKAIALLAGQTTEVATLAIQYGKNMGLAYQLIDDVLDFTGTSASLGEGSLSDIRQGIVTAPILFAMEEFPQLRAVVYEGFDNSANVNLALEYLGKSRGTQRTKELAMKHANLAAAAIDSLPESGDEEVRKSRRALVDLTRIVITRTK